ncbi:hypothetical protein [Iningainema tapete]|nr:hypothetical protein [Iningainema tapete]
MKQLNVFLQVYPLVEGLQQHPPGFTVIGIRGGAVRIVTEN